MTKLFSELKLIVDNLPLFMQKPTENHWKTLVPYRLVFFISYLLCSHLSGVHVEHVTSVRLNFMDALFQCKC